VSAEQSGGRRFRFGVGRDPFSNRARLLLAIVLGVGLIATVTASLILSSSSTQVPGRVVTIPLSDRSASAALLQAAAAVGFHSTAPKDAGGIESEPASAARASGTDLLPVGSVAPGFTLRAPEGKPFALAGTRGRPVLIEFFATWCPHCNAEGPHVERLYRSLSPAKVAFVAVNADGEDAPSILAFHIYYGMDFPALLDPSSHTGNFHSPGSPGPVSSAYRVRILPTFYVLDANGRIVWHAEGEQPDAAIRAELRRAAGGPAAPGGKTGVGGGCTVTATKPCASR